MTSLCSLKCRSGRPLFETFENIPRDRPTRTLNIGPPTHAATAILGCPSFATVTLLTRSPIDIPHARTVAPRRLSDRPLIVPTAARRATISPATTSIQVMDCAKATIVSAAVIARTAALGASGPMSVGQAA
eukprot:30931-Pelagococcus_subviridis.AAC.14